MEESDAVLNAEISKATCSDDKDVYSQMTLHGY